MRIAKVFGPLSTRSGQSRFWITDVQFTIDFFRRQFMAKIKYFVLTACDGNAPANKANAANAAEKTRRAAPTKDALVALEKSSYEAWKSKDAKFWDTFLSDKFVGYGSSGKLDKTSATKEYTGADC